MSDLYSTHQEALVRMLMRTEGPVLELGIGEYSSVIMHEICEKQGRYLKTVTQDDKWHKKYEFLSAPMHEIVLIPGGRELEAWQNNAEVIKQVPNTTEGRWGLAMIDQAPGSARVWTMHQIRNMTDFFLVHDTDEMQHYKYHSIFKTFKYSKWYKRLKPHTTVLSDLREIP